MIGRIQCVISPGSLCNVHFKGYAMNKLLEQIECPADLKKVNCEFVEFADLLDKIVKGAK